MKVKLTIVGIRNYCGGEEGYPQLFARLPIGANVYLGIDPAGTEFAGAVHVLDDKGEIIGYIANTQKLRIKAQIKETINGLLAVTVSGHSAEHNCMYVEAENNVGYSDPELYEIEPEEGETVIPYTDDDRHLTRSSNLFLTKLESFDSQNTGDVESLLETANDYFS